MLRKKTNVFFKNKMGKGKRLTEYIEKQGFKKKEFCETFNLDYNTMVRIMADKMTMGIIVVDRIHKIFPEMNIHWLLYGEGPEEVFFKENINVLKEPVEYYNPEINTFKGELLKALDDNEIKNKIYEILRSKK